MSNPTAALCKYCQEQHPLNYMRMVNGHMHMFYDCHNQRTSRGKPTRKRVFVPFVPGLYLPIIGSRKLIKSQQQQRQPDLL